jgi:hypothetical protein
MMDMNLQQLKGTLQMLALPITAQVHLDQNEVGRVERLRKIYRETHWHIRTEMAEQLTLGQKEVLARLDCLLFSMNPGTNRLVWSEEKLRQDAAWREVRTVAREALHRFNWPLDLPSGSLWINEIGNEDIWAEERPYMNCSYA